MYQPKMRLLLLFMKIVNKKIKTFGVFIKECRKREHLTQSELAHLLGIERAHLSRIESGKKKFRVEKLECLSAALNMDTATLKEEFYSDFFAEQIYINDCPDGVLEATRLKIALFRSSMLGKPV